METTPAGPFTFRHIDNVEGIGGIARIPDIDGRAVLVLYAVDAARDPDRQTVFEALDESWIAPGRPFAAYELPRGWPDRAALMRLAPETEAGAHRARWRPHPVAGRDEAHAIVEGLKAIGYFDPEHPESGGRRREVLARRRLPDTAGARIVPLFAARSIGP